jgi:hypothetical protein
MAVPPPGQKSPTSEGVPASRRAVVIGVSHATGRAGLPKAASGRRPAQSEDSSHASRRRTRRATVSLRFTTGASSQLSTRFE